MTALALILTGCLSQTQEDSSETVATDPDAIADAAAEEGALTWYTSIPEGVSSTVVDAFEAKYDVPSR
jgi:hypothetical protein